MFFYFLEKLNRVLSSSTELYVDGGLTKSHWVNFHQFYLQFVLD